MQPKLKSYAVCDKGKAIEIAIGQGLVKRAPGILSCKGLGSCVALVLYERQLRLGGLAHIMLPLADSREGASLTPFRYADTAVDALLKLLFARGAQRSRLAALLAGGAHLFADDLDTGVSIGACNVQMLHAMLQRRDIPLSAEDVGGGYGRNLVMDLKTGRVVVTSHGRPDRFLQVINNVHA